jgi:hypothetical protein
MTISLPVDKMAKISAFAADLLTRKVCPIRDVARMSGLIISSFRAVLPSKLHYRALEHLKITSLEKNNNDYDKSVVLTAEARSDLHWWVVNAPNANGVSLQKSQDIVSITTDASPSGWGAHCYELKTRGNWSQVETGRHINYLELLAVLFALKVFIRLDRRKLIRVYCDNTTAVTYINNMIPSLDLLSAQIWQWCLDRNCEIESFHLPGRQNYCADYLSRVPCSRLEWKLDPDIFQQVCKVSFMPDVDLFASRLKTQLVRFVFWKPDPDAWFYNAFSQPWKGFIPYIFPPFSFLGKVLQKIQYDRVPKALVIAPCWPTSAWYPTLLSLLFDRHAILLPQKPDLLTLNGT